MGGRHDSVVASLEETGSIRAPGQKGCLGPLLSDLQVGWVCL